MESNGTPLPAFIDDGYERPFCVAPVAGLHSGLTGTFRPARHAVRLDLLRKEPTWKDGDEESQYVSRLIVRHVKSWAGRANVDLDGAERLHADIRNKLLAQILGSAAPELEADAKN